MYYIFVIRARCTRGAACRFAHSISLIADRQAEKMFFFACHGGFCFDENLTFRHSATVEKISTPNQRESIAKFLIVTLKIGSLDGFKFNF